MRICLIRPPILVPGRNQTLMFTPPLGVAYLAGALVSDGFEVTVIDGLGAAIEACHPAEYGCFLYGLTLDEVVNRIPSDSEIIGISAGFSIEWPVCAALAAKIRQRFPDRLLIGGGEHVTAMAERSLESSELDIGVLGEGEETLVEIARRRAEQSLDLDKIPGIAYKAGDGEIRRTPRRQRIRSIDEIPWPAWNLIPIEEYLKRGLGFGVNRGPSMPVLASRGCPYQCTFCSSPQMWTTRWLARDPDQLLDELEHYQKRFGATNFDFYDLTAIVKKAWIVEFCEKVAERGMSFTWQLPTGTRSEAIDQEVAELLYRSGCRNLSYSPESGSPTVLKLIKKKIKPDRMLESMRSSVATGLNVKSTIMLGFPDESIKQVLETYWFLVRMAMVGVHDISIWAFTPYPGSELFERLENEGKVLVDEKYYDGLRSYTDTSSTKSYSRHLTDRQLRNLRRFGMVLFYGSSWLRRPYRPFQIVINLLRGRHESRGEMAIANLVRRMRMARST